MVKVGMLSLGCPRNLVDSEVMVGLLSKAGYDLTGEIADSDVAVLNTCAFIRQAKEESVDAILQAARLKEEGKIRALIVCGCLPQRYKEELPDELAEVDAFVGCGDHPRIVQVLERVLNGERVYEVGIPEFIYDHSTPRTAVTPAHFTYVKVAEGCSHRCSFCIIGLLRGRFRSRPIDSILKEARSLVRRGVKEINLVSQDTTAYGRDLYGGPRLAELLRGLSEIKNLHWIRALYTHPANFTEDLIKTITDHPNVCKYIDIPLQHINNRILEAMARPTRSEDIVNLINNLRSKIAGLTLRTTFIVGFPGETEEEFRELLDFIRKIKFERLGIFTYSREEGTPAYNLPHQVKESVKQERLDEAMRLQQDISKDLNQHLLGKVVEVLIDEQDLSHPNLFLARSQADAPEVDGQVFLRSEKARVGEFLKVKIVDTLEYDLIGEEVELTK